MKEKRFPWIGLPSDFNHDDLSVLQLKILRNIAKLSENVFSVVPRIQTYNIKPFILLHYLLEIKLIIARMKKLFSLKSSGKELSQFQMRSLDIQNFFLKEMVMKSVLPKMNVGSKIVNEMIEVMEIANELEYPDMMHCVWCGENILLLTVILENYIFHLFYCMIFTLTDRVCHDSSFIILTLLSINL